MGELNKRACRASMKNVCVKCVHCSKSRVEPCTINFGKEIVRGKWFCPDCGRTFSAG